MDCSALTSPLFNVFQAVWESEVIPSSWINTMLVNVFKDKESGDHSILDNYRHLHIKQDIPKVFEHLVLSEVKATINKNLTKFQIGARTGHRLQEHLFVLKSVMSQYAQNKKRFSCQRGTSASSSIGKTSGMLLTRSTA